MPTQLNDPLLQNAMAEITKILKHYDIGAQVILVSGNGHSEYLNYLVGPTWSCLSVEPAPGGVWGIRLRSMARSAPVINRLQERIKLRRTVNACFLMRDTLHMLLLQVHRLIDAIEAIADVEVGEAIHTPNRKTPNLKHCDKCGSSVSPQ